MKKFIEALFCDAGDKKPALLLQFLSRNARKFHGSMGTETIVFQLTFLNSIHIW